ncbi:uncharacterized protein [Cherax quadricarinatus]|uniref:uncharacterized protein n=1 Tax=Cherax quadricarinatus TaxID=27406 RepID=UPI002379EB77|nr:uncharacterized protein LOC128700848 [Cherax quadricarinatus]
MPFRTQQVVASRMATGSARDRWNRNSTIYSAPSSSLGSFPGFSSQAGAAAAAQDTPPPPGISVTPGSCPSCKIGDLHNVYPTCGICAAICLFPLGLAILYMLRGQQCDVCGYVAGR